MKIGIIGAGIAGLASAVRMAARGHEVDVFEANAYPGGKLAEIEVNGYRFDAGPSLFTMPHYVDELFHLAGENPSDHFRYERLPVVCNYFWEDGQRLSAYADPADFAREVREKLGVSEAAILDMLQDSATKYQVTGRIFLEKSLHRWQTWASAKVAKAMLRIPSLDLFSSMNAVHEKRLPHPKLVQLFNRFATYNGSNPYKAPGLLSIIPHFEHGIGAYYPEGGMYQITRSLFDLAQRLGVRFHFNTRVSRILLNGNRASGLETPEGVLSFDRIISNMDIFFTYRHLLPDTPAPERILRQEKSSSALIFYWGIKKRFPELHMHNILFSRDYRDEFAHIARGEVSDDPTVYINTTVRYSSGDAPEGSENWFTMINVPHISGQDWDAIIARSRDQVKRKISRMLRVDIDSLIEAESILEPRTIESRTASHLGSLYGTSSNNRMAAFMRHPNFSRKIEHLYFCGGSVHPGGGIPLALLSARIIDDILHA